MSGEMPAPQRDALPNCAKVEVLKKMAARPASLIEEKKLILEEERKEARRIILDLACTGGNIWCKEDISRSTYTNSAMASGLRGLCRSQRSIIVSAELHRNLTRSSS